MARDWRHFWDGPHRIYVSRRHRDHHYAALARDILALLPSEPARMLDYGCGEALDAARVAQRCRHLWLADAAPSVLAALERRFDGDPRITVLACAQVAELPPASLDLVLVCSVAQYLGRDELRSLLEVLRPLLAPRGRLVLADILPRDDHALGEALALLRLAWRHGFLLAALSGLAATLLSDYARLRRTVGLTRYGPDEIEGLIEAAGMAPARAARNLGFNQRRGTWIATLPQGD